MAGSELVVRLQARVAALEKVLRPLAEAEQTYRGCHDLYGDDHPKTGRAWDLMRRFGDAARALLGEAK